MELSHRRKREKAGSARGALNLGVLAFFLAVALLAARVPSVATAGSAKAAAGPERESRAVTVVLRSTVGAPGEPVGPSRPEGVRTPGSPAREEERTLSFFNTHNFEHLTVVYRRGDEYVPEALEKIKHILRDPFNSEEHAPDPKLLDFLWDLLDKLNCHYEVYIVCGYRCVETNAALHKLSSQVVLNSQHIKGKALDFRVPGCNTYKLYTTAKSMKRGGTGYYKQSDFVHIDTGPVRYW